MANQSIADRSIHVSAKTVPSTTSDLDRRQSQQKPEGEKTFHANWDQHGAATHSFPGHYSQRRGEY